MKEFLLFIAGGICMLLIVLRVETKRDYQLDIHNDTLWLYDKRKFVGKCVDTSWNSPLMQLIYKDNE